MGFFRGDYLWGKPHRLNVVERSGRHEVQVGRGKIHLYVNAGTSLENRTLVLSEHYREVLKARIAALLEYWRPEVGVVVTNWGVKKMKTKWGSCNTEARRIWLNLELAKKPAECSEYILVHELVHLLEQKHNERFKSYMDQLLPNWQERRDLLNSLPLAHNNWVC